MSDDLKFDGVVAVLTGADGRLADPGFLVNAYPGEVLGLVDAAAGPAARLAGAVYRASAHLHRDADAGVRRQLLALDAARYGDRELAARITAVPLRDEPAPQWGVDWATGSLVDFRFRGFLVGHNEAVRAATTVVIGGRPHAITGSRRRAARVWELTAVRQVGAPLLAHGGPVWAVTTTEMDGRPHAVTGDYDGAVRLWDLTTGRQVGEPLIGHEGRVWTAAAAVVDGRLQVITGGPDRTVRVWDLTTDKPVGRPLHGHTGTVRAIALTVIDGRPHVLTCGGEAVRVRDLTTGEQVGRRHPAGRRPRYLEQPLPTH